MTRRSLSWALLCLVAGCAALPERGSDSAAPAPELASVAVELADTPFYPQTRYQCGPAALATVLTASGVPVTPEILEPELFVPERRSALQLDLVGAVRRRERLPVRVAGGLPEVVQQLQAGRAVLVLQNLGLSWLPRWHYAVVVGYDPERDQVVLRSGTTQREILSRRRFQATWDRADRWGLVLLGPQQEPRAVDRAAYLQAAAGLESTGHHQAALQAFDSALTRWPGDTIALLGRANNLDQVGRLDEAEDGYRRLLAAAPADRAGINNLVTLLLELDRPCAAAEVLAAVPESDLPWVVSLAADPRMRDCTSAVPIGTQRLPSHPGGAEGHHD